MSRAPQCLLTVLLWAVPLQIVRAELPANDLARLRTGHVKAAALQGKGGVPRSVFPRSKYVPATLPPASPASRLPRWSSVSGISIRPSRNTNEGLKGGLIQLDGEMNFRRLQREKSGK